MTAHQWSDADTDLDGQKRYHLANRPVSVGLDTVGDPISYES
jgi:hypothetical protein